MQEATAGIEYNRQPRPEWLERLRSITGDNPNLPSLHLHWEPGDDWGPVQRWIFYQTWPDHMVRPEYIKECRGPHPRSSGSFDKRLGYWTGGPSMYITRSQWEIYRACGRYGTPFWVVQGEHGGHKYRLNRWESRLSQLCGGPRDTASPGDMPFAEPDERTWEKLARADRMRQNTRTIDYLLDHPWELTDDEKAEARRVAVEVLQWCGMQFAEHADELAWALKNESLIPRPRAGTVLEELDEDAVMESETNELVKDLT